MAYQQFYRSKLIFSALKEEETRTSKNEANSTTNIYHNPVPGTSSTADVVFSNEIVVAENGSNKNEANSTISVADDVAFNFSNEFYLPDDKELYSSDDSVTDTDYVPPLKKKVRKRFSFDGGDSEDCFEDLMLPEPTFPIEDLLPQPPPISPNPERPIFVATYPDSIVFIDFEQASCYVPPARFSAMYPGPIYDLSKSSVTPDEDMEPAKVTKLKMKHPMMPKTCDCKCRRSCNFFTQKEREDIWNNYWNMNYTSRRQFLNKCIKIEPIKQKTTSFDNPNKVHNKNESRYYYFSHMGKEKNVCKSFFLQTLGYRTDGVITELSRAIKRKPLFEDVKENRGGKKPPIPKAPIQEHIMSYNPALSHYRRNNAPLTRYLPRTLTLQSMLNDFKLKNPDSKCSIETYRKTMKQMKVSLNYPKGDQCVECGIFEEKIKNGDETVETLRDDYASHKTKAAKAIKQYREDGTCLNTATDHIYSMDLQKVTLLPDMPKVKDSFFLSRLVSFNLTFAPIIKDADINSKCVVWHEALMGRDATNIVDALVAFLQSERDVKHLTLWCDNCTGQNKNWFLYTALVKIVNSQCLDVETITIKYLTKGHTHMSADGVHGNIERDFKRRDGVYDFDDYKDIIAHCRKNIDVIEVQKSYHWTKKKRVARRNAKDDPLNTFLISPVVEAKFTIGSRNLLYKTDFEEPYKELNFLIHKFDITKLPPIANTIPRGVKPSKKCGIVSKLVPLMPISRREFWLNLPTNERSVDLVSDGQVINDE